MKGVMNALKSFEINLTKKMPVAIRQKAEKANETIRAKGGQGKGVAIVFFSFAGGFDKFLHANGTASWAAQKANAPAAMMLISGYLMNCVKRRKIMVKAMDAQPMMNPRASLTVLAGEVGETRYQMAQPKRLAIKLLPVRKKRYQKSIEETRMLRTNQPDCTKCRKKSQKNKADEQDTVDGAV